MGRAPCCDKANVKKGPWSPEEDVKLKAYIEKYGTGGNWIALPQKIGLKRCGKSCRLRWLNYLRPNIKHGGFTEEEDNIICSLYISIGSRWSIIAAQLPGRTDNDIKNYWNTKLKKKLLGRRKQPNLSRFLADPKDGKTTSGDGESYTPTLSNSALERLQLHMQLQSLQNPVSFNNPALWPKLYPLQEKMLQNLQSMNHGTTSPLLPHSPQRTARESINGSISSESSMAFNGGNNLTEPTMTAKSECLEESNYNAEMQVQAELNELMHSNKDGQAAAFDCFREMDQISKESMMNWWTNEFSSWDDASSTVLQSDQSVFQDYSLDYN
ncbi:hypothetical protein Ancab_027737 [Ancistrocladus abbreviatus]